MSATVVSMGNNAELISEKDNDDSRLEELEGLEAEIENATRNAYMVVGGHLKSINEKGLYKVQRAAPVAGRYSFETWEEYVSERWTMDVRRAQRLVQAAEGAEKMRQICRVLPANESQVRALLTVEDEKDRAAIWKGLVGTKQKITAKVIEDEIERFQASKAKNWITLEEWNGMAKSDREKAWHVPNHGQQFNKQDNANIEWAQWSWNPVTGCKHDCPYCYARDIAERFYPQKFAPALYPERLFIPANSAIPERAKSDARYRNVFTCSMSDLFGRWVPAEWIGAVLETIKNAPNWNFLTLTKFPNRIVDFQIPPNAWMGTTVDKQARVANAEKAFSRFECGVKWLSIEPMLEPLTFSRLDLFDWVVIGGASRSARTPEWHPPFRWILDLIDQCNEVNVKVYFKSNLLDKSTARILELPFDAPIPEDESDLPESLRYLGNQHKNLG